MASLLVIRLMPDTPVTGTAFTDYLTGLTITAFDSSFAIPFPDAAAPQLGSAVYNAPDLTAGSGWPLSPPDYTGSSIVQHIKLVTTIPFNVFEFEAVATAVIVLPDYPAAGEYMRADPWLQISRGGSIISDPQIYYNVDLVTGVPNPPPPPDPNTFQATLTVTGINVFLPPAGAQSAAELLPSNGSAPNFDTLLQAVTNCLNSDPGSLLNIASLTVDQCIHIASELLWDETTDPIPLPPNKDDLGDLYTGPVTSGSSSENDRKRFEGDLQAYYVTRNAKAQKLAGYIFSLSCALYCESQSSSANRSGFFFPVLPGTPGTETAKVILSGVGAAALAPPFLVAAKYFYALTAVLPYQISAAQRFQLTTRDAAAQVTDAINQAINDRVITSVAGDPTLDQVARRLTALGLTSEKGTPVYTLNPGTNAQTLVTDWLNFPGPDIAVFWAALTAADASGQYDLLLCVVTGNFAPLIAAIPAPPFNALTPAQLQAKTNTDWENLFNANPALLPDFTKPGTTPERIQAFIRALRNYFVVNVSAPAAVAAVADDLSGLFRTPGNPVDALLAQYPGFAFSGWNPGLLAAALNVIFPGDPKAQQQFTSWLECIKVLIGLSAGVGTPELQFSVMEGLWSAGFTSVASVAELSLEEFTAALAGTVAYPSATIIWANAGGVGPGSGPGTGSFQPVNPSGELVDCIPPPQLSPLGPLAYLHELLLVAEESSCKEPFPTGSATTLAATLTNRRGPIGNLLATRSNLETPVPLIDIVNESLEFMVATGAAAGTVYDNTNLHAPEVLLECEPEHATPATPVAMQQAYTLLKNDFSACELPYSQPLDVSRSYLRQLGTNRYDTMRHFRKEITEFVLDPGNAPAGFQDWLWRYPVKIDTAIEYLCITPEEYTAVFQPGGQNPAALYGYSEKEKGNRKNKSWIGQVIALPEFLRRTCLSYCDFVALWKCGFVKFGRKEEPDFVFPDCEPCCLDSYVLEFIDPQDPALALTQLMVFIRLWRKLNGCDCGSDCRCGNEVHHRHYSFDELSDICTVLGLFQGNAVNPDFIRQLAAFQMLVDNFHLRLRPHHRAAAGASGLARTPLLALWSAAAPAELVDWATEQLLDALHDYAATHHDCQRRREPEFLKILRDNLDALSDLAGFNHALAADTWQASPAHTLRFAEVLAKIYASPFSIGEVLFLFTNQYHLDGDDPFPLQTINEAEDLPLDLPDDSKQDSLWALRKKMLEIKPDGERVRDWSWASIGRAMRERFGYKPAAGSDPLLELGKHFFPDRLAEEAISVSADERGYSTALNLADTSETMWNNAPYQPFHYDAAAQKLHLRIPLSDEAVIDKLNHIRQLNAPEQAAVQELYFLPRLALAPFAFLFPDFPQAERRLIEEEDEAERWAYFRERFALTWERSELIARHLAEHVQGRGFCGEEEEEEEKHLSGTAAAHVILRHLWADENKSQTPWENDNGSAPVLTWGPMPSGGSYAALLGLCGTGMMGAYTGQDAALRWQEIRGRTEAFGKQDDKRDAQIPTILPSMGLVFTPEQLRFAMVRNGFACADHDGRQLGGAEAFKATWSAVLVIEREGEYCFMAGDPTPEGQSPDFWKIAKFHHWKVKLQRGQKKWILLDHHWHAPAPEHDSGPVALKQGTYELTIELERKPFGFSFGEEVCPQSGGFQVKYQGPDSEGCKKTIPVRQLFTAAKNDTLAKGVIFPKTQDGAPGAAESFLATFYGSTLRDIRRTYQRAFKALLFTSRFKLSGETAHHRPHSEIGYMLSKPDLFAGQAYYRNGGLFMTHRAGFDFNFLPVADNYNSPSAAQDDRVDPSLQRRQAMFDWWERVFDYVVVKKQACHSPAHPLWMLFYNAGQMIDDIAAELVRYLGVDTRHDQLLLQYFQATAAGQLFTVGLSELKDDRWTVRLWHSEKWIRHLRRDFFEKDITKALPYTWVADDPIVATAAGLQPGNQNLTSFYLAGCTENGEIRRYKEVKTLNDGLRERGRRALVAYLTHQDRVLLPSGAFAENARQLSELLLLDVEVGICEKASRADELVTAIQLFVMRARLGLEPGFTISPAFQRLWDQRFADFQTWEACARKLIYKENWVECELLSKDQHTEAFQFLASELRSASLTIPMPGGLAWWDAVKPPHHAGIELLQDRHASAIQLTSPAFDEGTDILGTPDYHARQSWLAPFLNKTAPPQNPGPNDNPVILLDKKRKKTAVKEAVAAPGNNLPPAVDAESLPMWFKAAVRLGVQFVRVAAAGIPSASTNFDPKCNRTGDEGCCCHCGKKHPALIDEYYFWLEDSRYFEEITQVAEQGAGVAAPDDPTTDWDNPANPNALAKLLQWPSKPMVHLRWCRVHNGLFQEPSQSAEGVEISDPMSVNPPVFPGLVFLGRSGDSLNFSVTTGIVPPELIPPGGPPLVPPGFRYDLATDEAVVLPLVVPPPAPAPVGGLSAFPFFGWFDPGAPVVPLSMYGTAIAVAGHLRAHCQFEDALKWYEWVYDPLASDNRWVVCEDNRKEEQSWDACCCASDPVPYYKVKNRAILMLYLETLMQWGDALMREKRPESFQKARLIFDTVEKITGRVPVTIFGKTDDRKAPAVSAFVSACAPLNPRLMCLYLKMQDSLELIHRCMDAARIKNGKLGKDMFYFGDSELRDCWKTGSELCCCGEEDCIPQSPYRFLFLVQKATEAASDLRSLGTNLLAAYEKGDAEYLSALRTQQERQLTDLSGELSQNQWREADWQLQALKKTKEISQTRLQYYNGLIAAGLTQGEAAYEPLTITSTSLRTAGNISVAVGQIMNIIPDSYVGENNFVKLPIGSKLASIFGAAGTIANSAADIVNTMGSLGLTKDGWDRRMAEWKYEVSVLTIEIEQIQRQILAAERRKAIALRQLNNQQQQLENINETRGFIRDKFTGHAFYLWLQQETAALHYQMYELTMQYARQAQRAFNFERGHTAFEFLPCKLWNNLYEGLLSGERLDTSLRHMEKSYYDKNRREYEITKHISCRQHFPEAFLQLQTAGYCEIEVPEWLFDMDYPGQYMRRIKNVTMTLPCVAGPYTGVNCRLTLLSSSTRVKPELFKPVHLCCDDDRCNNGYEMLPDDPRMLHLYAATEGIATSGGMNESGTFEVNFHDERYLHFEFMGAISRWRIELPKENNYFNLKTLSDLVLHLNYTSREGGDNLRRAAKECALRHLPGNGVRFFDVRRELSDAWQLFLGNRSDCASRKKLGLSLSRNMFPFLPGSVEIAVNRIEILFEAPCADPGRHHMLEFMVGKRHGEIHDGNCACDVRPVVCIADERWPGLFRGALELEPVEMEGVRRADLGVFRFPEALREIGDVYLFCQFQKVTLNPCICQSH